MGWIGAIGGAVLGARGGLLYSLAGAALGSWLEDRVRGKKGGARLDADADARERMVLGAIAALLAKVAKADGHVTLDEVHCCERFFDQLGLRGEKRAFCIHVFHVAKNDGRTVYDHAEAFVRSGATHAVRELVYGVLWDLACADGALTPAERAMLFNLVVPLRLDPGLFTWHCHRHGAASGGARPGEWAAEDAREDPYAVLGCRASDSDAVVRRAYRDKAKKLHPDVLRAQGVSEALLDKANDQMARVNAAWSEIKKARGL